MSHESIAHQDHTNIPMLRLCAIGRKATDIDAITARALFSRQLLVVYTALVKRGLFSFTDINSGVVKTTGEDSMGVVTAACSIIRFYYSGDRAALAYDPHSHMGLSIESRHLLAAALFLAYKMKSEDTWRNGQMAYHVLSMFVTALEYPTEDAKRRMPEVVMRTEAILLAQAPVHSLVDGNIASVVEHQLDHLLKKKILTEAVCISILSLLGHVHYRLTAVVDTELIETLCAEFGMHDVACSFVKLCIEITNSCKSFNGNEQVYNINYCNPDTYRLAITLIKSLLKVHVRLSPCVHTKLRLMLNRSTLKRAVCSLEAGLFVSLS